MLAKFNYRIKWFDGWDNHKLILDNYVSRGPLLPTTPGWVLLERASAAEE